MKGHYFNLKRSQKNSGAAQTVRDIKMFSEKVVRNKIFYDKVREAFQDRPKIPKNLSLLRLPKNQINI